MAINYGKGKNTSNYNLHKAPSTYILLNLKATYKYKCDKIPMNLGHVHFKSKFCPCYPRSPGLLGVGV